MIDKAVQQQFERNVLTRLRGLGRRLRLYIMIDGLAYLTLALIAAILITLFVDRIFKLNWDMRLVQLATLLIAIGIIAWQAILKPLYIPIRHEQLALLVERRFPQLQSSLISAVDFIDKVKSKSHEISGRSSIMMNEVVRQSATQAANLRFQEILAHARFRRQFAITLISAGMLIVVFLTARQTMGLWFQRNVLLQDIEWPQRNRLTVENLVNGKIIAPRGDDLAVSATVDRGFKSPRQVYIEYQSETGLSGEKQMPAVTGETIRFTHTFEQIDETLRCRIFGGDAQTDWFTIEVVDRPRISNMVIGITPPAYTRIDKYDLRPGQTVAEALTGSRIHFHIKTNKPVFQAKLIRTIKDQQVEIGQVEYIGGDALKFTADDVPPESATYYFHLTDRIGITNQSERIQPVRMSVRLLPDRPPKTKIKITDIGDMITTKAILPVVTDFSDTYGLASAELVYELSRENAQPTAEPLDEFEPGTKTYTHTVDWMATDHQLVDGDRLTLYTQAADFNDISGPNLGRSSKITLRVVGENEMMKELSRREQEYRQDFERMIRLQEELYADVLDAGKSDDSQKSSRLFRQLARRQRDQVGRVNTLRQQFEQVLSELRINQLATPHVEARLSGSIIQPMVKVGRSQMPSAADSLDQLSRQYSPETQRTVHNNQEVILENMNKILANMLKWERYAEAINLLREVLKMQRKVNIETEKQLETQIFGTEKSEQ